MVAGGLTEKGTSQHSVSFYFYSCGEIPPPVIMIENVSFRYSDNTPFIYKNLEFGVDLDTRLALVGRKLKVLHMTVNSYIYLIRSQWCGKIHVTEVDLR